MNDLKVRLERVNTIIEEICAISGTPGVSIGILHYNEVIYSKSFGYRNVGKKIPPDEHTIYYLASLSKSFTVAALGILIDQKALSWDTQVKELMTEFEQIDQLIASTSTVVDWLSHRAGVAPKNSFFLGEYGRLLLPRDETLRTVGYLEKVYEFRTRWLYNNWGYALADEIIDRVNDRTWAEILQQSILDPLGMKRTIMTHETELDNIAEGYIALANGEPFHVPRPGFEEGSSMEGAAGVQSSVHDLLIYYKELLRAAEDQRKSGKHATENCPFKQVMPMWTGHVDISPFPTGRERSYGLGWIRAQLPAPLGDVGMNPNLLRDMPIVGKGLADGPVVIYHQGSTPGFLTSVHLIPETSTAIIVLTNSLANNDAADWLGQLLVETIIDNERKNDYVELTKASTKNFLDKWPRMAKELEDKRVPDTPVRPLDAYIGQYFNAVGNWYIDVFIKDGRLQMCFQGDRKQTYTLEHYNYDVFSWLLSHDQDARRGRWWIFHAAFYLMKFEVADAGDISRLIWKHDPFVPEGETFIKTVEFVEEKTRKIKSALPDSIELQ